MLSVQDAYSVIEKIKPDCKLLECLEFEDFYAYFMVPKTYNGDGVAGAYDTVNKKTGLVSSFVPTENLKLYMSGKVVELDMQR